VQDSTHHDISFLATELGKSTDILVRVVISARLEHTFKLPAPIFYAFRRQQIPSTLPNPLLDASQNFTLIDPLIQNVASLIFALSSQIQTQAITSAIALDYIGQQFTRQISELVQDLQQHKAADMLSQPYLMGIRRFCRCLLWRGSR
jgi:hypothetical protein